MWTLPIQRARAGMILGVDIELAGRPFLRAGSVLSLSDLRRLEELGIRTLVVADRTTPAPALPSDGGLLSKKTRRAAFRVVRRQMERLRRGLPLESPPIFLAVEAILDEVLAGSEAVLQWSEIRAMDDYPFAHSVSVAAAAALVGVHSGLAMPDLKALAVGALLHDVGKVGLPDHIWNKPGPLADEERRQIQEHAAIGYALLRDEPAFDIRSAYVAHQHHERWDGAGYPRGLARDEIHRFARIVAVVDVFDALTTDRPYRPAWRRDMAISYIEEQAARAFDPEVVRTFLARVAPYPVGSWVRLNTGETAQVLRLNRGAPARPVVRLLGGSAAELDLSADLGRRIVGPAPFEAPG